MAVTRRGGSRDAREAGHTLLIVMCIVAIMMIGTTVAMKTWTSIAKREREEELIFRGRQYAMAIYLFRKQRGTLPTDLKQLEEMGPAQTFVLRRPYKDPMTGGDFGLVFAGPNNTPIPDEPVDPSGAGSTGAAGSSLSGFPSGSNSGGSGSSTGFGNPSSPTNSGQGSTRTGIPSGSNSTSGFGSNSPLAPAAGSTTGNGMPIMGIHSKSNELAQGPARWHDLEHYNQWFFLITDITGPQAVVPGAPGQGVQNPGVRGPGTGTITPPGGGTQQHADED